MIEKMVPLELPPGIVKNGTMYQRANRWADGNLVRFTEGGPQALGNYSTLETPTAAPGGEPHVARIFGDSSGDPYAVVGTATKLYFVNHNPGGASADLTNITPAAFPGSTENFRWQFDVLGVKIIAIGGGVAYSYDTDAGGAAATAITGAPATVTGGFVTPENFVVVFDATGDRNVLRWASQGTLTTWTPATSNSAGSLSMPIIGTFLAGRRASGLSLVWTSGGELIGLTYVGAPLYYGHRRLGDNCTIIGPNAHAQVGTSTYWMGERGFFQYDGYVRPVPCDIADTIFGDMASTKRDLITALVNSPWSEIWWLWPSASGSGARDRLAIYNYRDGTWSYGALARATGTDAVWPGTWVNGGKRAVPLLFDANGTTIYAHEAGGAIAGAYLESGPLLLDPAGSSVVRVQKVAPDNNQTTAAENLTLYAGTWPKVAETSQVISIPAAGGEPLDARLSGRYIRYKQELTREDSRIGTPRLGVTIEGRR